MAVRPLTTTGSGMPSIAAVAAPGSLATGGSPNPSTPIVTAVASAPVAPTFPTGVGLVRIEAIDPRSNRPFPVAVRYPTGDIAGPVETPEARALVGSFPLVVLVHGYAVSAETYATMARKLAAAGFVVASPELPRSSTAMTSSPSRDIAGQAVDVRAVIDLFQPPTGGPGVLDGAVSARPVTVLGHSDGAVTAAGVTFNSAAADPRVGAGVILSGGAFGFDGRWFEAAVQPALLVVHGTADEVNPFWASTSMFERATGPKMFVSVTGGSHLGSFTNQPSTDAVALLVADFLRARISGDRAAAARLGADAENPGVLHLEGLVGID